MTVITANGEGDNRMPADYVGAKYCAYGNFIGTRGEFYGWIAKPAK